MSKKKKIIIGSSILLIIILVIVFLSLKNKGDDTLTVQTSKVERQKVVQTVTATGIIQPNVKVKISADISAKIIGLYVKEGQWVEKGDLLVQLDRERFSAAVESAEANLRSVESNTVLARENKLRAEKDYMRTRELFEKNLTAQADLDQAYANAQVENARHKSAFEQVDQAKAVLKQTRDDLSKTTIYSPMAGTISELNKENGEIALGSQFQEDVIMVVSNLSAMEALVDVDENDIVSVAVGDSATIEVDALPDKVFHGMVSEIASSAKISGAGTSDQKTEFEVKVRITDPGDALRPGMTASSDIIAEIRKDALSIPIQCVTVRTPEQLKKELPKGVAIADTSQKQEFIPDKDGFVEVVFLIRDGHAIAKQVKTGIQSETHIEVVEGLSEGDEIVSGSYRAISETLQNYTEVVVKNNGPKK